MELNLAEKFLLLGLHPEKGRFTISDIHRSYGLVGAVLLDMSMDGRIELENNRVLLKEKRSGDPVVAEVSAILANARKPYKLQTWISRLSSKSRKFRWEYLNAMERKRVIRIEHRKFLGLIPYRKCYVQNHDLRSNLIQQLRDSILYRKDIDNVGIALLGLVEACQMHKTISPDRDEQKRLKKELKTLIKESPIASAVDQTIKQVQVAILASVAAASAAARAGSR